MMLPDGRPVASTPTTLAQILLSSNAAAPATAAVPLGSYATPPPAPLLPAAPLLPMLPVAAAAVPVNTPPRPRAAYGASRSKTPLPPDEVHRRAQAEGLTLLRSAGASVSGYRFVFSCSKPRTPFQAKLKITESGRSRQQHLGYFASAEEAALAVARFIAQPNSHVADSEVRDALDQTVLPPPPLPPRLASTTSQGETSGAASPPPPGPPLGWAPLPPPGVAPAAPAAPEVAVEARAAGMAPVVLQPPGLSPPGANMPVAPAVVVATVDVDPSSPVVALAPLADMNASLPATVCPAVAAPMLTAWPPGPYMYAGLAAAFASPAFASGYGDAAAHCQQSGALLPPVFAASPLATLATHAPAASATVAAAIAADVLSSSSSVLSTVNSQEWNE
jgi:hypothetical protein